MSGAIDADFLGATATMGQIEPYLDPAWRGYLRLDAPNDILIRRGVIPLGVPRRRDRAAESLDPRDAPARALEYLERHGIERAIVNPGTAGGLSGYGSPFLAAALARATNDWLAAQWLERDDRFLGSIVVGAGDAGLAAQEIRRVAGDPRFAQVVLAYPPCLLGDRFLHPVYEAAQECGLPVSLQAGGAYAGANRGLVAEGFAGTPWEMELQWVAVGQAHLLSALAQGIFERFPALKLVLSGFGIAWLPSLLWRIEMDHGGDALERPVTLRRSAGEYLRDHVRFTLEGIELGTDPAALATLMGLVGLDVLTMFSSGYPAQDDTPVRLLDALDARTRERVRRDTAVGFFGLGAERRAPASADGAATR